MKTRAGLRVPGVGEVFDRAGGLYVPLGYPALFAGAAMYADFTAANSDGTFGKVWFPQQGRFVNASSAISRQTSGGIALDASGNFVSFSGTALRATSAGLTTEVASTNLALNSAAPTVANGWGINNSTTTVQATGPGAGLLWYLYDDGVASAGHNIGTANIAFVSGTTYTFSAIVQYVNAQFIQLFFGAGPFTAAFANFDILNGVVASTSGVLSSTIQQIAPGRFIVSVTATAASTVATPVDYTVVPLGTSGRLPTYTGAHNQFLLWNTQVEALGYYTSPIVNAASALTRAQDGLAFSDVSWLTAAPASAGLGAKFTSANVPAAASRLLALNNGAAANNVVLDVSASGAPRIFGTGASTALATASAAVIAANTQYKVAAALTAAGSSAAISENGATAVTATGSSGAISGLSGAQIGVELSGASPGNYVIQQLWAFPIAPSAAQLQAQSALP